VIVPSWATPELELLDLVSPLLETDARPLAVVLADAFPEMLF
jgi:hypothetical protein